MPQTSVASMDLGVEGQLAGNGPKDCYPVRNDEASAEIPFGRMLAAGAAQDEALLLALTTDKLIGVSVFGQAYAHDNELGSTGFKPGTSFDVLRKGRIVVKVEDAVSPSGSVHVRIGGAAPGAFRGTAEATALVVADLTFTAEADDDTLTAAGHGLQTGDGPINVANSGGALPTGLAPATSYWVIRTGPNTFKLASSLANAKSGTAINITADGTGTQTLSDTGGTQRLRTMDLSKLARWRSSAGANGYAELELDMTLADLAAL